MCAEMSAIRVRIDVRSFRYSHMFITQHNKSFKMLLQEDHRKILWCSLSLLSRVCMSIDYANSDSNHSNKRDEHSWRTADFIPHVELRSPNLTTDFKHSWGIEILFQKYLKESGHPQFLTHSSSQIASKWESSSADPFLSNHYDWPAIGPPYRSSQPPFK